MGEGRGRLWGGGVRRVGGRELGGSRRERRFWREWWYGGLVGEGRCFGRAMGKNKLRGGGGEASGVSAYSVSKPLKHKSLLYKINTLCFTMKTLLLLTPDQT